MIGHGAHVIALVFLAGLALGQTGQGSENPSAQPEELGRVKWSRNLDRGLDASARSGKPVLLLFQEVPG
jgi:hypothetical protein